ncbi:MAG: DUF3536 domain-containing protein [Ignavibacteria bacterium]|jgi:alpha-amylase/alpha-mannosidase (GH57 family)|nr:DUF3536 domain-containing protein [Ignavibacteria bacterium]
MERYVCIHGHFYQPPRENPWLEEIEVQDSAYPYRDWNERINAECYSPNTAARIQAGDGTVLNILNNYSKISFNFGPTLLLWMEKHSPDTYKSIIQADIESRELYSGHGSAIAQVYNHMIMPLANTNDKRTQIIWGIADFKFRFGREPEGMWLAETAVDNETLDILAEFGIKFTILAPRQAKQVKPMDSEEWTDVSNASIDPKMAYLCRLPSGRTINLFFYDGPISQELAFGDLLKNGENLANRLVGTFRDDDAPQLANIATDGETYGHHAKHGDMALAYCLNFIESNNLAKITVYGEFLEKYPPTHEVEIIEDTSWSCIHGIERWRSNCGCNTGRPGWGQEWRAPLREALDWLRDELIGFYEKGVADFTEAPWKLRDDYINVILDRRPESLNKFFSSFSSNGFTDEKKTRILKLLEMERHALLMYTSCGWFFDEISGIETIQVIMYAGRAIQLARELGGPDLEAEFIKRLEKAPSNIPEVQNGGRAYEMYVKPAFIDMLRVAAHFAIKALFENKKDEEGTEIFSYKVAEDSDERFEAGRQRMIIGRALMHSNITLEDTPVSYAVIHFGDQIVNGGVREFKGDEAFNEMKSELIDAFQKMNLVEMVLLLDKHFGTHNYTLWHLFKDESRKVYHIIMRKTLEEIEFSFRQIYENHYPLMQALVDARLPLPKAISTAVEFVINLDILKILESSEPIDNEKLTKLSAEAKKWSIQLENQRLSYVASKRINKMSQKLAEDPMNTSLMNEMADDLISLHGIGLDLNMWKAQNILFLVGQDHLHPMKSKARKGTQYAQKWMGNFKKLEHEMQIKLEET